MLAIVLIVGCLTSVVALVFSPRIDEKLGIVTTHALASIQEHREGGRSVKEIVAAKYREPRWQAYHHDFLTETYVRCETLRSDGTTITLQWFVRAVPRLRPGLHLENKVATALNQDALSVAPSLREPGHPIYNSPDIAY